jgi:phosphotransferase system HPr (HPr) family protein
MTSAEEHSAEMVIKNLMGFHVRPVQRFAELARMFTADVQVALRDRDVPGKSVMNLMSLGGRRGDRIKVTARGQDARQCVNVLKFLTENSFFVEDNLDGGGDPDRHLQRLASMAACFDSDIKAIIDEQSADAKALDALRMLKLTPTSEPRLLIQGCDAEQARAVLEHLVEHCFFVEQQMGRKKGKAR